MRGDGASRALERLAGDHSGGVAVLFACALPLIILLVCGAVDLTSVHGDRQKAQDVADAAALMAAKQMGLSDSKGVNERATAFVRQELSRMNDRFNYKVAAVTAEDGASVRVSIDGRRTSFFANLLPPGGWRISVAATAGAVGRVPLCVLSSGVDQGSAVDMREASRVTAPGCLFHANSDIEVSNTAWLQAATTQSVGKATGRISPAPQQSAPPIDDPFRGMSITPPALSLKLCTPLDLVFQLGIQVLAPGVHCGNLRAAKNATVRLLPGEHYFAKGQLELREQSVLQGDDVVLIFDDSSAFKFTDGSQISLTGRRNGRYAGFVLATTRANRNVFEISSSSARQLLGTIYIPEATLKVTGSANRVADQSAWTVIVAKSIKMEGSPDLVVNSNYGGSPVQPPTGVGPNAVDPVLVR